MINEISVYDDSSDSAKISYLVQEVDKITSVISESAIKQGNMWCKIEENPDVVVIDGLRFSREIFKHLADKNNIGRMFKLVANCGDGTIIIE